MPRHSTLTSGLPRVHLVEDDLAADGRNADAVAVAADAGDDAFENATRQRRVERSESQRVQQRDRPRAHREDVADDAADAGRGALVRLDERRVVVRFDLEDRAHAVADVDRAGVFAGPLHDARAGRRQRLQVHARALVAAVLGPHHREQAELEQVGLAAHQLLDALVLVRLDAVSFENCCVDHCHVSITSRRDSSAFTADASTTRPSALPSGELGGALGMRHQAHDVALAIADAGDAVERAVRIVMRRETSPAASA